MAAYVDLNFIILEETGCCIVDVTNDVVDLIYVSVQTVKDYSVIAKDVLKNNLSVMLL